MSGGTDWDKAYMNARRHPRTMTEAFGPYTDNQLHPMPDRSDYTAGWWIAMVCCAVVTLVLIFTTT